MQNKYLRITALIAAMGVAGVMSGCANKSAKPTPAPVAAAAPAAVMAKAVVEQNFFMVHHENGRLYVLGDAKLYRVFLDTDEVALTRTRISAGPDGQTLIFGMNKDDAKRGGPTSAESIYDGQTTGADPFYGEVFKNGRYYVFGLWSDMANYLKHGEVPLTYTEIGTGPRGETVIYALNKKSAKEGKPVALIERFQKQHGSK